jgi:GntR family transcriptional regulator
VIYLNDITGQMRIDFRSGEPITLQIVRQIKQLVEQGRLKQGDQLPTVRELATELRINFSTVARAYKILDEERVISTQRGRGTYIWDRPESETGEQERRRTVEELARRYLQEAQRLGYSSDTAIAIVSEIAGTEPAENIDSEQKSKERYE